MRNSARLNLCPFLLALLALAPTAARAQNGAVDGAWRYYSGDMGSTKYAPLDQIDAGNVGELRIVWRRPAVDARILEDNPGLSFSNNFRATPLMVGGVLYSSNGVGLVEAFDPGTGRTLWVQRPLREGARAARGSATRGVAYWSDASDARILFTRGEFLIALSAKTGRPYPDFGDNGKVNLSTAMGPPRARYRWTGAPLVIGDVVVLGTSMTDSPATKEQPRGDVRAYDVRTGELRWTFNVIPRAGQFGTETWENEAWRYTGNANLWSLISADEELGTVYLPLSSSTSDMYGAHRLGDNLFSQSLVCVDAETGRRIWHFQFVHHGLWDYDLPAAPILADITVDGKAIKAVVQVTKQAFAFVLDRVTGEPVWPIEERDVPESNTPGEQTSRTQPFPTKPPPFDRQGVSIDDLIDFTPELRAEAIEIAKDFVIGPMFTPPSLAGEEPGATLGTIQLPGSAGGADWQGAALDPETGMLYVQSITGPFVADLVRGDPSRTNLGYVRHTRRYIRGPQGLPLLKPPYGRVTAIDLNRGEVVWTAANGEGPRNHPAIRHLNLPRLGVPGRAAPLLTRTLLFVGEGDPIMVRAYRVPEGMDPLTAAGGGGNKFRAYDKATGEVLWETEFPAGTTGAPMTYMFEGKQYIVVAIGGRQHRAEFVALSLP